MCEQVDRTLHHKINMPNILKFHYFPKIPDLFTPKIWIFCSITPIFQGFYFVLGAAIPCPYHLVHSRNRFASVKYHRQLVVVLQSLRALHQSQTDA